MLLRPFSLFPRICLPVVLFLLESARCSMMMKRFKLQLLTLLLSTGLFFTLQQTILKLLRLPLVVSLPFDVFVFAKAVFYIAALDAAVLYSEAVNAASAGVAALWMQAVHVATVDAASTDAASESDWWSGAASSCLPSTAPPLDPVAIARYQFCEAPECLFVSTWLQRFCLMVGTV